MQLRLHRAQVSKLSQSLVALLTEQSQYVEVGDGLDEEFRKDIDSVLISYVKTDRRITDVARSIIEERGEEYNTLYRVKKDLAKRENFGLGDEAPGYIAEQLIRGFMHSPNVEEIYAPDHQIRALIIPELRSAMSNQRNIQKEVEQRLKHLERGSTDWEDQFQLISARLKEKYNLDD